MHRAPMSPAQVLALSVAAALLLPSCAPRLQGGPNQRVVDNDDEHERNRRELERLARQSTPDDHPETRPILPVTVVEPPLTAAERGEGRIERNVLSGFLEQGPHAILQAVVVDPVFEDEAFRGFRIDWVSASPAGLADSGLRVGDVVTAVNGVDISQPEGFMRVWDSLSEADHLHVDIVRSGEARTLAWDIE